VLAAVGAIADAPALAVAGGSIPGARTDADGDPLAIATAGGETRATSRALARSIDASARSAASSATSPATRNARANGAAGSRARQFEQKLETGSTREPHAAQRTSRCTDPDSQETVTVASDASAVRAAR
jgi:hypothetical protein